MKALLITGSNGWLGKAIISNLINSFEYFSKIDLLIIHSLDQINSLSENEIFLLRKNKINFVKIVGSISDGTLIKSIKKISLLSEIKEIKVIHTASVIHPKKVSDFHKVNFLGTIDLYNYLKKLNLAKFTYISSNSPFGFNKRKSPFDQYSKYNPLGGYGKSKKCTEEFLLGLKEKKSIIILRAPWFHGKEMPVRQAKFLIKASKGKFPIVGKGENRRSLVNTIDLAKAALNVTLYKCKNNTYWISDSDSYPTKKIIYIIQKSYAKNKKIKAKSKAIYLPKGTSTFFCFLDLMLQKIGIYNMYLHVLGELGQNIECSSKEYWNEFTNHKSMDFEESIDEEMQEAYSKIYN